MNIENMTLIELESLAYREVSTLEQAKANLAMLSQMIQKRQQEKQDVPKAKVKKK